MPFGSQRTTWRYISEDRNLHSHRPEKHKTYKFFEGGFEVLVVFAMKSSVFWDDIIEWALHVCVDMKLLRYKIRMKPAFPNVDSLRVCIASALQMSHRGKYSDHDGQQLNTDCLCTGKTHFFPLTSTAFKCAFVTVLLMARRERYGAATTMADDASVRSVSSEDVSYGGMRGQCCVKAANPAYKRGRRLQLLQMLVLPFIPILALIFQTAITLHDILIYRQEVSDIEAQVCVWQYTCHK
jgi:hypothetical protein